MTREDYISWAAEYRQQVDALEKVIQKRKSQILSRFKNAQERAIAERALSELYAMKEDCIRTAATLEQRAAVMPSEISFNTSKSGGNN